MPEYRGGEMEKGRKVTQQAFFSTPFYTYEMPFPFLFFFVFPIFLAPLACLYLIL